jgi:hypothetical protein
VKRHVRLVTVIALITLIAGVAAGVATIYRGADEDPPVRRPVREAAAAALLEDNTLVLFDSSGAVTSRRRLGRAPAEPLGAKYLAADGAGDLRAIVPGDQRDELVFLDRRGDIVRRVPLPSGIHFRALEVGQSSGRHFLAGEVETDRVTEFDGPARSAVAAVLSPTGDLLATSTLREPGDDTVQGASFDWHVYDIAVDREERRIFVSYHGPNTAGADRIAYDGRELKRCEAPLSSTGCIRKVHGAVEQSLAEWA